MAVQLTPDRFFASRTGVCVYVAVSGRTFRVRFVTPDAWGVIDEGPHAEAQQALAIARAALQEHLALLEPLFERVTRD